MGPSRGTVYDVLISIGVVKQAGAEDLYNKCFKIPNKINNYSKQRSWITPPSMRSTISILFIEICMYFTDYSKTMFSLCIVSCYTCQCHLMN